MLARSHDVHAEKRVALPEPHPDDAARVPPHGTKNLVTCREANTHSLRRRKENIVIRRHQTCTDHLVVFGEIDRDNPALPIRVVIAQACFLHLAAAGGEHQVVGCVVPGNGQNGRDGLLGPECQQVGHVLALRIPARVG